MTGSSFSHVDIQRSSDPVGTDSEVCTGLDVGMADRSFWKSSVSPSPNSEVISNVGDVVAVDVVMMGDIVSTTGVLSRSDRSVSAETDEDDGDGACKVKGDEVESVEFPLFASKMFRSQSSGFGVGVVLMSTS